MSFFGQTAWETSSSGILYRNNINPILNDERSVNLGTVYESAPPAASSKMTCKSSFLIEFDGF